MKQAAPNHHVRTVFVGAALALSAFACGGESARHEDRSWGDTEEEDIVPAAKPAEAGAASAAPSFPELDAGQKGALDAGADAGGGAGIDASVDDGGTDAAADGGGTVINGCSVSGVGGIPFVDRSSGNRKILFSENGAVAPYTIPCMAIRVNQKVEFAGSFKRYPLEPMNGATPSPIKPTDDGDEEEFKFRRPGIYGFHARTQPTKMLGAIMVSP